MEDSLFTNHKVVDKKTEQLNQIVSEGMGEAEVCPAISKEKGIDTSSDGYEPSHSESPIVSPPPSVNPWETMPSSVQEFVDRLVLIGKGSKVADLYAPRHFSIMPMRDFINQYSNIIFLEGKKQVTEPKQWMKSPERKNVHCESFRPGDPVFCKDEYGG
jgi:hypothetical protein